MAAAGSLGLGFLGTPTIPEMVRLAQKAEERGFASVWVAETRFRRDAVTSVAAIAAATRHVRVATGLVNVYTRNPVLLAVTAASLDELSYGRFILGVGTGSEEVLAAEGQAYIRPYTRLREYIEVLRLLLAGETVRFQGETISLAGARLEVVPSRPILLYLGVTGPRGLTLAGKVADGILLDVFMPVSYIHRAVEVVRESNRTAGRPAESVEIAAMVITVVGQSTAEARDSVRPAIAGYLSKFPTIAAQSGFPPSLIETLQGETRAKGPQGGAQYVTDEVVDALCVAGTAEECRAGVNRFRAAGVSTVVLATPGDPRPLIEAFGA